MAEPSERSPLQVDQLRVLGNACAHERKMHQGLNCTPWQRAETILWALQQDGWDLTNASPEVSRG